MTTPLQPLLTVLDQAESARDEAMACLENARKASEASRQQLQSLHDFRAQYQTRWQSQFRQSGGMEIMRCYTDFMARLADAEAEQQRRTDQTKAVVEHCRAALVERERKVAAVTQLIRRRAQEQSLQEQRRDQKATDEMAARLMSSSPGPLSTGAVTSHPA